MTIRDAAAIGKRVRDWRERNGVTLNRLAESAGISKGHLSQFETGDVPRPSLEMLAKLAEAMGQPLQTLLEEPDDTKTGELNLPEGLQRFVAEREVAGHPLPAEDIEMLRNMRYRGQQPRTAQDWRYLYETIERTIR